MKTAHNRRIFIGFAIIILFTFFVGVYWNGIIGYYIFRYAQWEEDLYKGKTLQELELLLNKNKSRLVPEMEANYIGITGKHLNERQSVYKFQKGESYRVIPMGTGINEGWVIVERQGSIDRVIEILHRQSVDSL